MHSTQILKKRIAIVGAGAAGLASLRVFLEEPASKQGHWEIIAFEARDDIGGIWLPDDLPNDPASTPQTPLYDVLVTNIPHPVMAYHDYPFPPSTPLCPHASVVLKYLRSYARTFGLEKHISLSTRVQNVVWNCDTRKWDVTLRTSGGSPRSDSFDTVVVANGHYHTPRYPDIPGLSEWAECEGQDRGVSHAMWYRTHHPFAGKSVMVIGGGHSGMDIGVDIAVVAKRVLLAGARQGVQLPNIENRSRVKQIQPDGVILFDDGSTAEGVDRIVLATGYLYNFPFLQNIQRTPLPSPYSPLPSQSTATPLYLENSGIHVYPLMKHIFPLQRTFPPHALPFIGMATRIAPFPFFEDQAKAAAFLVAHPDALDVEHEKEVLRARWERVKEQAGGDGNGLRLARLWHEFDMERDEQFEYRQGLVDFAGARGRGDVKEWEREFFKLGFIIRPEWRLLEREGRAEDIVRGVASGSEKTAEEQEREWIEAMRRVVGMARERSGLSL
ncbi:hypothetical protein BOTBODRAFT_69400 [Botryobasidium botryosum FD-172 SS1]|uniref:FAD/NAD(P)-binding domain-containing protein n=1 Tax=Botryobasidium botryosum (strain FD-172 SS1) TaxID=930990 RepID=A0A067M0E8_BOTB1|nr:hypothetical protein BOTBODRAFT_69400 [Botryobasidium botryosum FD-172 SS1]